MHGMISMIGQNPKKFSTLIASNMIYSDGTAKNYLLHKPLPFPEAQPAEIQAIKLHWHKRVCWTSRKGVERILDSIYLHQPSSQIFAECRIAECQEPSCMQAWWTTSVTTYLVPKARVVIAWLSDLLCQAMEGLDSNDESFTYMSLLTKAVSCPQSRVGQIYVRV